MKQLGDIIETILKERQAQDAQWGPAHDDSHSVYEWCALICRHAGLGIDDGAGGFDRQRWQRQLVRVAALAVAALESLERHVEMGSGPRATGTVPEKVAGPSTPEALGKGW